jgi:repressor LexA
MLKKVSMTNIIYIRIANIKGFTMFGDNLKIARKARGLTQKELADKLGITASAITQIEKGMTMPDINRINVISDILNISPSELFKGKIEKPNISHRPLIGSASCGVPSAYYYEGDYEPIPVPKGVGENAYYVRADGDSMTPRINHGDLVLCDIDQAIESGNLVHFEWDGEHGIKQYVEQGSLRMMVAINSAYPPIMITDEYELRMSKVIMRQEWM